MSGRRRSVAAAERANAAAPVRRAGEWAERLTSTKLLAQLQTRAVRAKPARSTASRGPAPGAVLADLVTADNATVAATLGGVGAAV